MGRRIPLASALALGAVVAASLLAPIASATPSAAPAYTWASLIGGSSNDTVTAAVAAPDGSLYLLGRTDSYNFPATSGAASGSLNGRSDVFLAKVQATGRQLAFATYLGGGSDEVPSGIALGSNGLVYITGLTNSSTFPTTLDVPDRSLSGPGDAFLTSVDGSTGRIVASTLLGGNGTDFPRGLGVNGAGMPVVCGYTNSADFPLTVGSYASAGAGGMDAFATAFSANLTEVKASARFGGPGDDDVTSCALGGDGSVVLAGTSFSSSIPTTGGAFQVSPSAGADQFIAVISPTLRTLDAATWFGPAADILCVAGGPGGDVFVSGYSEPSPLPAALPFPVTADAFDRVANGTRDAFVARFDWSLSTLRYATLLGGAGEETGYGVAVDANGSAYIAGWTNSADFPLVGAFDNYSVGPSEAFAAIVSPTGSALEFSSLLGGSETDVGWGISLDGNGTVLTWGTTNSWDMRLTQSRFQNALAGQFDGFVADIGLDRPPLANMTVLPTSGSRFQDFTLNATLSFDRESTALSYRYDFDGDGSWDTGNLSYAVVAHRYSSTGNYTAVVEVRDLAGHAATARVPVRIWNIQPSVALTVTPRTVHMDEEVSFNASGSFDPDGQGPREAQLEFRFDFEGDGTFDTPWSDQPVVLHRFSAAGLYLSRVEVRDAAGAVAWAAAEANVYNEAPAAVFTVSPSQASAGQPVAFVALGSHDLENATTELEFRWDFEGDGTWDIQWGPEHSVTHTYVSAGPMTPRLEVRDWWGAVGSALRFLTVEDAFPTASFTLSRRVGTVADLFSANASASGDFESGLDGVVLRWDFEGDGVWDTDWTVERIVEWRFARAGNFRVTLQVMDTAGQTSTRVADVIVENADPDAVLVVSPSEGNILTLFAVDPTATTDRETNAGLLEVRFDFNGDGLWDTPWQSMRSDGHQFPVPGPYNVTVQVRDPNGGTTTVRAPVLVVDDPPRAVLRVASEGGMCTSACRAAPRPTLVIEAHDLEDPDVLLAVRWDFDGDGVWDTDWGRQGNITANLSVPGRYTVMAEVHDGAGNTHRVSIEVEVVETSSPLDGATGLGVGLAALVVLLGAVAMAFLYWPRPSRRPPPEGGGRPPGAP